MSGSRQAAAYVLAFAVGLVATEVSAQDLARRVSDLGTGIARLSYPLREDAEICDEGVRIGDSRVMWNGRGRNVATGCVAERVWVELRVAAGVVRDVDVLDGDDVRDPSAADLGERTAAEAADYLFGVAREGGDEDAVFAAVLADVAEPWVELLAIARDPAVGGEVRGNALFWLGQEAGDAITVGIAAVAADEREEQEVREAAIFALSQRPSEEGVVPLMEIARTAREAETRETAMFWLAQSDDARVISFFEEILLGR
jgi:hypothetical protein